MKLLNTRYDNFKFPQAIESALLLLKNKKNASIFFLNADCFYKAQFDNQYRDILNSGDLVFLDGIGIRLILAFWGIKMLDNCNGTDLSPILMKEASYCEYKIFFLGGKSGVAEKAALNIKREIPSITIVGTCSGFFTDSDCVVDKINSSGADILFVAMGVPLQEKWIALNRRQLKPKLCLGVGALFDYLSDTMPRAPMFMRFIGLEWLWRILIDPSRMIKRYVVDGGKLFILILKYKFFPKTIPQ